MIGFKPKDDFSDQNIHSDIKLHYCAYDGCEPNKRWGPGMMDHYKLFFALAGSGSFDIGNQSFEINPASGFVIPPNVVASYKPLIEGEWQYFWITFSGKNADVYLHRANLSKEQPIFTIDDANTFQSYFSDLFHSISHSKSMDLKALSAFYNLMSMIIDHCSTDCKSNEHITQQDYYLNQSIEFIQTNYTRHLQIEEIANYVSVDRKYLYQIFKDKLNQSPKQYLIDLRMKRAIDLLKSSDLSILQIANSIGYADPFLFSKMFKKKTGSSPTEHRLQNS